MTGSASTTTRPRWPAVSVTGSSTASAPSCGCRAALATATPRSSQTGESEDGVIFRGDLGFDHQLTETTKIVDRFLVEAGSDNTYVQNDLGLEVTISGGLGLRVGYQVRHNTDVLPGVEKTDTLTTVGLLYETK